MQFVIAALIGAVAVALASWVGRILLALGVGFVTFYGISELGTWVKSMMQGSMSGLPADALGLLGFLWVDKAITMIFSAWVAALAMRMGGSDTITALILKKGTS